MRPRGRPETTSGEVAGGASPSGSPSLCPCVAPFAEPDPWRALPEYDSAALRAVPKVRGKRAGPGFGNPWGALAGAGGERRARPRGARPGDNEHWRRGAGCKGGVRTRPPAPGFGRTHPGSGPRPPPTYVKGPLHTGRGGGDLTAPPGVARRVPRARVLAILSAPHGSPKNGQNCGKSPTPERSFEIPIFRLPLPPSEGAVCGPPGPPVGRPPGVAPRPRRGPPSAPSGAHGGPRREPRQGPARTPRGRPHRGGAAASDSSGSPPGLCGPVWRVTP